MFLQVAEEMWFAGNTERPLWWKIYTAWNWSPGYFGISANATNAERFMLWCTR